MKLPLFLHAVPPLASIIVNDEILNFDDCGVHTLYTQRSLQFLLFLMESEQLAEDIPANLMGADTVNLLKKAISQSPTLTGFTGFYEGFDVSPSRLCFDGKISIDKNQEQQIVLTDLTYNKKPLNYEVSFTAFEAFMIFSNLIVQTRIESLLESIPTGSYTGNIPKDFFTLQSVITSDSNLFIHTFIKNYLEFVSNQVQAGKLTPLSILNYGGISTLILLSNLDTVQNFIKNSIINLLHSSDTLSRVEKIMFFSLTVCLAYYIKFKFYDETIFPELKILFSKKEKLETILSDLKLLDFSPLTEYLTTSYLLKE